MSTQNHLQLTLAELNELNHKFWLQESELRDRRIADSLLYDIATMGMSSEVKRGVSLYSRKTLELALADAEYEKRSILSDRAAKAGKAPKGDALNRLVLDEVRANPKITERQLLKRLEQQVGEGTILSISSKDALLAGDVRTIRFQTVEGKEKEAPVSGLKDRLFRAKAQLDSR